MDKIDFIYISNEKFKEIGNAFDELYLNEPIKVNTYISQGELAFKHCYFVLVGVQGNLWQLEMSWSYNKKRLLIDDEERGFSAEVKNSHVIMENFSNHKGRFAQDITVGYESKEKKQWLKGAMESQGKTIQDFVAQVSVVFFMLNILITHLPQKARETTTKDKMTILEKKGNQKKYKSVVYLKHSYIIDEHFKLNKSEIKHIIKCPAWGVRGHYRYLSSGKVIFIKPYTKGKHRNDLSQYANKQYKI